ncbi:hypothetical protein PICMEDRAFT_72274 [Pichia membranifaciens NRRL Y-2026]|uniref:Helicase C-terminal domain-containing protein n=1 Tax=Pichia membranifaciens NRRL Y-2026 TaxID=763406 RepID=A0A1E3NJ62_9ASCO|nr:hypothetical protein PICMEDRAFT_72274 [Pichia membranifaciens NRRL Y-2026]ODQ46184.1 hypothetical protein PICMEDRAFT_72274 [Pichia membranifaciens NRRL Y-2026]
MGTKLISNGIDVSNVNLVVFSGYSPQDIEFIQGLGRIRGQGLCVVLNHNQFCGANIMGRFYGFKDKDHFWCCGRPEDEELLAMFDSVIGDEDNRSKVHEDSAILNSSFRVEDLGLDLNFALFEVTSTPCKNGGGEKRSLDEDIDLENLSEMYHEMFSEYPELNTCEKEGLTSPIGYLVLIHLLLVQIIKFSRPCLNEAASCLAGRLIQSSNIFVFLAPTLVADDCMDVFGFGVYKYIYILK